MSSQAQWPGMEVQRYVNGYGSPRRSASIEFRAALSGIKVRDVVSVGSVAIYLTYSILGSSEFAEIPQLEQFIALLLPCSAVAALITLVMEFWETSRRILVMAISACIITMATFASSSLLLFMSFIMVVSSRGTSRQLFAKAILGVIISECFVVFVSSMAGIISNNEIIASSNLNSSQIVYRHTLGFNHQNTVGGFLFAAYICYMYLRFNKLSMIDLVVSILLFLFLYWYINTKTISIILLGSSIIIVCILLFRHTSISMRKCLFVLSAGLSVLGIILPVLYLVDPVDMSFINQLLTNRLQLAAIGFEDYGVALFGQDVSFVSTALAIQTGVQGFVLDNSFAHLVVQYGLFAAVLVYAFYYYSLRKANIENNEAVLFLLVLVFASAITENWFFNVAMNPLPILLVCSEQDSSLKMAKSKKLSANFKILR